MKDYRMICMLFFCCAVHLLVWQAVAEDKRETIVRLLTSDSTSLKPFGVPVHIRACAINKSPIRLDGKLVEETLAAIQNSRPIKYMEGNEILEGISYDLRYSVLLNDGCETSADLIITVETGMGRKAQDQSTFVGTKSFAVIRVPSTMGSGELAGRVAGWIISASSGYLAPDLSRKLFFSLLDDGGAEVSIVGFHHQVETFNPLLGLDLQKIAHHVRSWIGVQENKVIAKASTRDIDDHPGVLTALLRSRQRQAGESYDPMTGRFSLTAAATALYVDPLEFVRGVSESSDALFRVGSAARLIRLRRREVEVYGILGQHPQEQFRDGSRLYVTGTDVVILVPPEHGGHFNLTNYLLYALADCLGGVSSSHHLHQVRAQRPDAQVNSSFIRLQEFPSWISEQAVRNVVLNGLSKTVSVLRESFRSVSISQIDLKALVEDLEQVRTSIEKGNWAEARKLVGGSLREKVKAVARMAKMEKKKCCETRLVAADSAGGSHRRFRLILVYLLVGTAVLSSVGFIVWFSRHPPSHQPRDLKTLFGRQHLD